MDKKDSVDDNVIRSDCTSQQDNVNSFGPVICAEANGVHSDVVDRTDVNKSSKEVEVARMSSEAIDPGTQSSIKSEISSDTGLPQNRKRKAEASCVDNGDGSSKMNEESSSSNSSHGFLLGSSQNKGHEVIKAEEDQQFKKIKLQVDDTSVETVGYLSSVDSVDPPKDDHCVETNGNIESFMEQDACDRSLAIPHICSDKSGQSQETGAASKDDNLSDHKPDDVATRNRSPHIFEFDLNEDLAIDDAVCSQQSNTESVSVYEPIAVVAKIGVPVGLPKTPLQFDGELGWKRGAAASAFRPAEVSSSNRNKGTTENLGQSVSCRGIDLNIAIGVDNLASESCVQESSVEVGSKQPAKFILDLNSKSETDEHRPKTEIRGFDLNDAYSDVYRTPQSGQSSVKHIPDDTRAASIATSRQSNFPAGPRPAYWVDLSTMPGFVQVQQAQPFLVAASPGAFSPNQQMQGVVPFQSKFTFAAPTPPGGMPTALYSPIILPPLSGQHGATAVPQMPGPMLAAFPGNAHLMEGAQRVNPSGLTNLRPSFILSTGLTSLQNVNHGPNVIEFLVPGRTTSVDERIKSVQQVALPPTSIKRRETDGGWRNCPISIDGLPRGARLI